MDKNLKAFLAIAEYGNLTLAADKIGLTQPSLTKRLSNLEAELNCQLFNRHRRGMTLTAAGKRFFRRAQRIEQEMLQAEEELRSLKNAGLDVLRIGAGPLFHQRYVAPVFSKLLLEFPSLRLDLTADLNERSLPMLIKGELDVVLGVIQPIRGDDTLQTIEMAVLEHGIIMSPTSGIAERPYVLPEHMSEMRWVIYGYDEVAEGWLDSYYQRNGLGSPHIVVRTASFATGLGLVRSSGFVMMAPVQLAPVIVEAGLRVLAANPAITSLTVGAYIRPSSIGFPAVKRFLQLLQEEFAVAGE
ncbi:MAG: LysR family transcriptional regulator [Rhizobiales bacterium]|nr:LysR family transcriptional regulator [Hyphomicrobiales bacterium]